MGVPTRKLVDKEGREIFSGDRKVVTPMLFSSGTGQSALTKGYDDHGLGYLQGNGWRGDVHLAGDGAVLTIPLDIKLKDITSVGWLEKTSTNTVYNNTLNIIYQIDFDDNGVFTETSDDRFLFSGWQFNYGHSSWEKIDGIAETNDDGHDTVMTFKLYDGAWTQKDTGDETISAGDAATFAAFQATDLGKHRVKALQIIYSGEKTGTADFWVQAANFEINGVFYELQPSVVDTIEASSYEFSINGVNFNGHAGIKTLMLEAIADSTHFTTLHHYNVAGNKVDYQVPAGKVFIAYQALVWSASASTIGRIGETETGLNSEAGTMEKDVLFLGNGTTYPFMVACYGVFGAGKYVTASAVDGNDLKQYSALFGVERDV